MKLTATICHDTEQTRLEYTGEVRLSQILADAGLTQPHPCGGHGKCGKCAVRAEGALSPMSQTERTALENAGFDPTQGWRLSCLCDATGDITLYYNITKSALQGLLAGFSKEFSLCAPRQGNGIGMAVDIGTTTVAAYLYDLQSGRLLDSLCRENPQKVHGADVISRVGYALSGGADELRSEIEHCLDELAKDMSTRAGVAYPDTVVAVGNSAMLHLLTGTDPSPLAAAPFILGRYFGEWEGGRYYPPCISAYVGADMTAAILASDMCKEGKTALLLDVGTNGEMALLHEGKLLCCSTAAGPAFEGAGISCGSLAIPGAICAVTACEGALRCETIDGKPAVGLCGTGLIDAIAALLELGALEDSGFMEEEDAPLGDSGLTLTRADIRQVQLAKAAIRAGIDTLLIEAGVGYEEIDTVYLAGGFGSYLHPESCAAIGMIPRELIGKLRVLGNAAGQGASLMLLSAEELAAAEDIAKSATTLELSSSMVFMEKYVDSMMF